MAHLPTLRDDCGLVNYTIPVKHYTIRHCQLQNNRQIAPHRILLNTIQRCSKLSKLSIAEQIFESNCDWLMKIMSGVFHQKETEEDVGATVKGLHQHLLLASYLQNVAEVETMLVESELGGEYWKSKWEKKCLRGTILETEQRRRLGGGVGAWVRLGGENPNVRANKVRMPCLSACDRMQGNRKARKKKFTRQHCHKLCTKLLALSLLVAAA